MVYSPQLTPDSTIDIPPTHVDITVGSQKPDPDRTIRVQHAKTYPLQVWYFLACFVFLLSIINFINIAMKYLRARRQRQELAQLSSSSSSNNSSSAQEPATRGSINLLRLPLALLDTFRALSFRWTISVSRSYTLNVMEVLLSAVYFAICITWSLVNSTSTKGVKFDPHYYANIAGNIATIQFPLIVALGMKNNIISLLTGVSFDKLIYLHGMVSRVLVVLIWIHAGGRLHLGLAGKVAITVPVIQAGILAGVSLTLLSIVSIKPIRDKAYEFFLVVHFILAVIAVLAAYFHASSLGFGQFLWPAILLWGLDRVLRICRIVIYALFKNRKVSAPVIESPTQIVSVPKLELLSKHFLRLTIPTPKFFYWRPGQSVYLTFPGISKSPLEAHPFTIATIDSGLTNSELKFFIRAHDGCTKRLLNSAEKVDEVKVLIDGPYSSPPSLVGYDSVLLIAGGSGISFTLPLFLDLIERSKTKGLACRRLTFAWTIRNIEHIGWIKSELLNALKSAPPNLILNVHIFITDTNHGTTQDHARIEDLEALDDDTSSEGEKSGHGHESEDTNEKVVETSSGIQNVRNVLSLPMVKAHQGRADLDKFIREETAMAKDVMSVNICGTHALANAVRKAIRYPRMTDILKGGPTISLHVEAFGSS